MIDHSADPNPPEPPAVRRAGVKHVLEQVRADAESDGAEVVADGVQDVAAGLGQLYAMIQALAHACLYLLAELEDVEKRTGVDR